MLRCAEREEREACNDAVECTFQAPQQIYVSENSLQKTLQTRLFFRKIKMREGYAAWCQRSAKEKSGPASNNSPSVNASSRAHSRSDVPTFIANIQTSICEKWVGESPSRTGCVGTERKQGVFGWSVNEGRKT
jgi:hypothetical protein